MRIPRRKFLRLAAGATALPAMPRIAKAEAYPSRSVHVIVGYAAAGPTDIAGRLISEWLSKRLGQQFHRRGPAGRGQQYRHRVCPAFSAGRLHAAAGHPIKRDQPDAL